MLSFLWRINLYSVVVRERQLYWQLCTLLWPVRTKKGFIFQLSVCSDLRFNIDLSPRGARWSDGLQPDADRNACDIHGIRTTRVIPNKVLPEQHQSKHQLPQNPEKSRNTVLHFSVHIQKTISFHVQKFCFRLSRGTYTCNITAQTVLNWDNPQTHAKTNTHCLTPFQDSNVESQLTNATKSS